MSDIVERLRQIPKFADFNAPPLIEHEAADEIERLRAENERMAKALERIAQHDMQAIAMDALRPGERIRAALEEGKK